MANTRVLIVDDNEEVREAMHTFLAGRPDITVVGEAGDGQAALRFLREHRVDVMLLDMIMPLMDGFAVLVQLHGMSEEMRPKVIAVTALCRDDFIQRAIELGVSYYMVKPIELPVLLDRIRDLAKEKRPVPSNVEFHLHMPGISLDDKLSNLFLTLGMPAHIKGYQFLREAIKLVIANPSLTGAITKELYPSIAKKYCTTSSKVERAIRHAIEVAWNRGRVESLNAAFGCTVVFPDVKPTNGEFIALIADKLSMDRTA